AVEAGSGGHGRDRQRRARAAVSNPIRVQRDGALAIVTIDHPPLNLYDAALDASLRAAVDELEREPARAVLFRAEGRVVSGGVDVSMFAALETAADAAELFAGLIAIARRV